ncbi:MAG: LamG domain-containing protein, partial [Myxococcota bacterium]
MPARRLQLLTLACLAWLALADSAGASSAGLVAAYGFDESSGSSVNDVSGSGNTGFLVTGATRTSAGKFGGAVVFDGATGLITIADSPSLDLTSGMTLEAWVYPTQPPSDWRDIIYKALDLYYLEGASPQNGGAPGTGGTFTSGQLFAASALPQNTWSHLAATYDGTTLRLYLNGTQIGTKAQTGPIHTSTAPLTIGGDGAYSQFWGGKIDEVRVYNRALSASEIVSDRDTPVNP